MPDDPDQDPEIKVTDRRQFRADGERIDSAPEPEAEPPDPPAAETALPAGASFEGLLMGLVTNALIDLGEVAGPSGAAGERNLPAAREAIDLLGILQEKTAGNLTPEEKNLLEYWLYRLRMDFTEKARPR